MVWLAMGAGAVVLAILVILVAVRWRRLRREHDQQMRIAARELGELERLGGAAGEILFGQRDVREPE